ncbi:MAG TPA: hypothetical protein VOA19_20165, partial [Actinomycetes bacterium]|nr:hypothetical protein [Actinomycetes bacterium]
PPIRRDHHGRQPGPAGGSVRSDQHGQLLDQQHIPATLDGYQQLRQWAARWSRRCWAIGGRPRGRTGVGQRLVAVAARSVPAVRRVRVEDQAVVLHLLTKRRVANMRVAVTQRIQQDGEWRDGDTSFPKVNVWRGQAERSGDFREPPPF